MGRSLDLLDCLLRQPKIVSEGAHFCARRIVDHRGSVTIDPNVLKPLKETLVGQSLRRDIKNLQATRAERPHRLRRLISLQGRVETPRQHAQRHGTHNVAGLFVSLVRANRWNFLTLADEDAARRALAGQLPVPSPDARSIERFSGDRTTERSSLCRRTEQLIRDVAEHCAFIQQPTIGKVARPLPIARRPREGASSADLCHVPAHAVRTPVPHDQRRPRRLCG